MSEIQISKIQMPKNPTCLKSACLMWFSDTQGFWDLNFLFWFQTVLLLCNTASEIWTLLFGFQTLTVFEFWAVNKEGKILNCLLNPLGVLAAKQVYLAKLFILVAIKVLLFCILVYHFPPLLVVVECLKSILQIQCLKFHTYCAVFQVIKT